MIRPARNALRAAVESGFPSARYAVQVVLFAPVEYLTYESRKAVLPARAALRIARNDFPCKGHPKQAQSISTTTPVYQRRICGAFCKLKKATARTKLRGKSKEGGRSPLLGRFKGFAKGQGSHANPAKRFVWEKEEQRNGRGLYAASGGQDEGCGVCSDATPP